MMKTNFSPKPASGTKATMCAGLGSKIICAAFAAAALCGCDWVFDPIYAKTEPEPEPEIKVVTVSPNSLTLVEGETATLNATLSTGADKPDASLLNEEVSWESDNTAVANVEPVDNTSCRITAIKSGTAVITAKPKSGNAIGQCTVTVRDNVLDCITDPAFKAYAAFCMDNENAGVDESGKDKNYPAWDGDGDDKLSLKEAAAVECVFLWTGFDGLKVQSLAGIEYFTGLKVLRCDFNTIDKLDLSHNTALTYLWCNNNQLTELNVNGCTALTDLWCHSNQLTELDVTKNTALTDLSCSDNQLTELDVTKNTALTDLVCFSNQLTELNVNGCTALRKLNCFSNQLTELDASNMADPTGYYLYCGQQKNSEGGDQQLTLTLREEQKEQWNKGLAFNSGGYGSYNKGVILAD